MDKLQGEVYCCIKCNAYMTHKLIGFAEPQGVCPSCGADIPADILELARQKTEEKGGE